jgi:hypothetical protein
VVLPSCTEKKKHYLPPNFIIVDTKEELKTFGGINLAMFGAILGNWEKIVRIAMVLGIM